jgi:hypothetical protein
MIYLSPSYKDEVLEYQKEMGYSSLSEMFRTAFRIMKQVLGSKHSHEPREPSLAEKLSSIEKRLSELQLEATLVKKQKEMVKEEIVATESEFNFDEVATELFNVIQDPDQFNGSVKDFAIMDYFKDKYSRGIVFYVLTELEKKGKLALDNGVWKINN